MNYDDKGDVSNSVRFAQMWADKVMFVPQVGRWFEFVDSKHRWCRDEMGLVTQHAIQTTRQLMIDAAKLLLDAAASGGSDALKKAAACEAQALVREATSSQRKPRIDAMLALASTSPALAVHKSMLDADSLKMGCQGGVIDLKNLVHSAGNPDDRITMAAAVEFNEKAVCPTWDRFLEEVQPDPQVRQYLQKFCGYCLTGETSEQMFVILQGGGQNGKSVFTETLKALLGDYSTATSFSTFAAHSAESIRNDIARLDKVRLVVAAESNEQIKLDEALMKNITGGESITARFLHKEFFTFTPQFKIVLVTNYLPKITGTDLGIWRRVVLVPWKVTIPEARKDIGFAGKLARELPGILNWALEGLKMYRTDGLRLPHALEDARSVYKTASDDFDDWFSDCLIFNEQAKTELIRLVESHRNWAKTLGRTPASDKRIAERLAEMPQLRASKMPLTKRKAFGGIAISL